MTFKVQARLCATCIYRPGFGWRLKHLEDQCRDRRTPWFFKSYRQCHHGKRGHKTCCRGFWNRHKHQFLMGQLAQRLGWVEFVNEDHL